MNLSKTNQPSFQKIEYHVKEYSWVVSLVPMERRYKLPDWFYVSHVETLSGGLKQVINTQLLNDRNDPGIGFEHRQRKTRTLGLIHQHLEGETP